MLTNICQFRALRVYRLYICVRQSLKRLYPRCSQHTLLSTIGVRVKLENYRSGAYPDRFTPLLNLNGGFHEVSQSCHVRNISDSLAYFKVPWTAWNISIRIAIAQFRTPGFST